MHVINFIFIYDVVNLFSIKKYQPIFRPKDSDPVMFRFLLTKTGFITFHVFHYFNLSFPKY